MTEVTIYHNPGCGTSRNTLALIRNAEVEPPIIEYLKHPPDRATLASLLSRMHMRPRELLRQKGTPYAELGLDADLRICSRSAHRRISSRWAHRRAPRILLLYGSLRTRSPDPRCRSLSRRPIQ